MAIRPNHVTIHVAEDGEKVGVVNISSILLESELNGAPDPQTLYIPNGDTVSRDAAFAYFIDAWGDLEHSLRGLLETLLGVDSQTSNVIADNTQSLAQQNVLSTALGRLVLTVDEQSEMKRLLKRVANFNTKRNRIVHGVWHLSVSVSQKDNMPFAKDVRWTRQGNPSDPAIAQKVFEGEKNIVSQWVFDTATLRNLAQFVTVLADEIAEFSRAVGRRLYPPNGALPLRRGERL